MTRSLIALIALSALACGGGPSITTTRDDAVPLPQTASWAWGQADTVSKFELDPAAQNPVLHMRVQMAIQNTLAQKGWTMVQDPADAQLVVTYHIGMKRQTEYQTTTTSVGGGWWGGYGWGYYGAPTYVVSNTTPVEYMQGGLLVIVRDSHTGNVAWNGLFKKDVSSTTTVTQERVQEGVTMLLKDLK